MLDSPIGIGILIVLFLLGGGLTIRVVRVAQHNARVNEHERSHPNAGATSEDADEVSAADAARLRAEVAEASRRSISEWS